MKSVLISIQPKWCELIASGKKTVEVRKTRPKLDTPFKVYIYCTKPKGKYDYGLCIDRGTCGTLKSVGLLSKCNYEFAERNDMPILSGKVIGEFVCGKIDFFSSADSEWAYMVAPAGSKMPMHEDEALCIMQEQGCLSLDDIIAYFGDEDYKAYFWHISDLVIYDNPKELSEFYTRCYSGCGNCEHVSRGYSYGGGIDLICTVSNKKPIKRPPQSWCYVEGGGSDA